MENIRFIKGYYDDAGVDVILTEPVIFEPKSTTVINLNIKWPTKKNTLTMIVVRSSAAVKGLLIANCPVDPYYTGDLHAIVFNASNDYVKYDKNESFCQLVTLKTKKPSFKNIYYKHKRTDKRNDNRFGSTGGVKC